MTPVTRIELAPGVQMPTVGLGLAGPTSDEAHQLIGAAIEVGYRNFDTGALYGNERGVGRAFADAANLRDELFLTTKLWVDDLGRDKVRPALEDSLERLRLDRVDLYLIHWPAPSLDLYVETWERLIELRDEGLTRAIGVSNFEPDHLDRLVAETAEVPAVNQIELHPYLTQEPLRAANARHGIATVAFSPLGVGKVLQDPKIVELASQYDVTPAQVILRWHLHLGVSPIPRTSSTARLPENLDVMGFELAPDDIEAISALNRDDRHWFDPNSFNGRADLTVKERQK